MPPRCVRGGKGSDGYGIADYYTSGDIHLRFACGCVRCFVS